MHSPPGLAERDTNGNILCWALQKSLYGLKQSSHNWNRSIAKFMTDYGFVQSKSDFCLFTLHDSGKSVKMVVYIHVDDGHCGYVNDEDWDHFFGALSEKFPTKDLGPLDI